MLSTCDLLRFHAKFAFCSTHQVSSTHKLIPKMARRRISCLLEEGACSPAKAPSNSARRSANYHPSIWHHHLIQSTSSPFANERSTARLEELKHEAKVLLESCKEASAQLVLIDSMKRLGVAHHLDKEINECLRDMDAKSFWSNVDSTHDIALGFRLLRQHGHHLSSDVFEKLRDGKGMFKVEPRDVRGLLSLYEASHLAMDGEDVLDEAREFSTKHLKLLQRQVDGNLAEQVGNALQVPLHWRMPRLEAKQFIGTYERMENHIPALLELAKLDFNITQSLHQAEMRDLSLWWNELGLAQQLKFSRDRLLENYLWAVGIAEQPHFSKCRLALTKQICILTVIDDAYDVYGLLEEVRFFTSAVKSWDVKAAESLPEYLKLCYLAMYNFVNDTAAELERSHGWNASALLKKEWQRLCEAYLREAEWFHKGYRPTLEEYLDNAWISVGGPIAMAHAYCFTAYHNPRCCNINDFSPSLAPLQGASQLIYWSSLIGRLNDDLGTSKAEMERGDVAKSVQCVMKETGAGEEASMESIRRLVSEAWKKLNEETTASRIPGSFARMVLNMARSSHSIFQHGDGVGAATGVTKSRIASLFFEPCAISF